MIIKESGIYKIKNIVTGDFYIGSACNIKRRWIEHRRDLKKNKHHSIYLQRAWNKYGRDNFEFSVVLLCDVEHKLYFEDGLIKLLHPAYNISEDASAPMQGRHHTEETRIKMRDAQKGKLFSEETRAKMREAWKTRAPVSKETCAKMSEASIGKPSGMLGKRHTEETRSKMSAASKKRWASRRETKLIEYVHITLLY